MAFPLRVLIVVEEEENHAAAAQFGELRALGVNACLAKPYTAEKIPTTLRVVFDAEMPAGGRMQEAEVSRGEGATSALLAPDFRLLTSDSWLLTPDSRR